MSFLPSSMAVPIFSKDPLSTPISSPYSYGSYPILHISEFIMVTVVEGEWKDPSIIKEEKQAVESYQ